MALNIIEKLRQKPKLVRDNIALGVAGSVTSLVLVAWFVTSTDKLVEVVETSKQGASAFSTFISHAKNEVSGVMETLPDKDELTEAASSSLQVQVSEQVTTQVVTPAEVDSRPVVRIATTSAATTSVATSTANDSI
jgi:hypothetical protein